MLGSDRLAGIGSASFTLGAALTMVPLAAFMRRRGRRPGMAGALLIGAAGSAIAATGGQLRFFPLFVVGMVLFGAGQASTLQGRYVAADLAEPEHQATAIAAIVWIGALGAAFGPLLTPFEKSMAGVVGLDELVGPFVFAAVMFLVAAGVVWMRLRPDPLEVIGGIDPTAERTRPIKQVRASVKVISASPGATLGIAAMAVSQAAMVGVMTMTPPHMKDHGHADLSAFVIALHIVGMYGLAPFVGRFVDRIGTIRSIQVGAVVLGAGTMSTVLAGYVPALMFVGLFFLGLGWNLGLIGGSTLLTSSVPTPTRVEVQGTSDLTMSLCGALAAFELRVRQGQFRLPPLGQRGCGTRSWTSRVRLAHRYSCEQGGTAGSQTRLTRNPILFCGVGHRAVMIVRSVPDDHHGDVAQPTDRPSRRNWAASARISSSKAVS